MILAAKEQFSEIARRQCFDTLYSVDLRYYAHSMGQPFDLTAYTQVHGITNVLLLGNIDYFSQDTFDPEG